MTLASDELCGVSYKLVTLKSMPYHSACKDSTKRRAAALKQMESSPIRRVVTGGFRAAKG